MGRGMILYIGGGPHAHRQGYARRLLGMVASGGIPLLPGQVTHVDVYHDGDCPALSGGLCQCEPELHMRGGTEGSEHA